MHSVFAFLRWGYAGGHAVACIANFTPVPRPGHRIGLPWPGHWQVLIDSDNGQFGGSGLPRRVVDGHLHGRAPLAGSAGLGRVRPAATRSRVARGGTPVTAAWRDPRLRPVVWASLTLGSAVGVFGFVFGVAAVSAGRIGVAGLRDVAARVHRGVAVLGRRRDCGRWLDGLRPWAVRCCSPHATVCTGWRWPAACPGRSADG